MAAETAVPDEILPHIQILQIGHGLLGQGRRRAQDVSKELNNSRNTDTAASISPTITHKRKEIDRLRLLIFSELLAALHFGR